MWESGHWKVCDKNLEKRVPFIWYITNKITWEKSFQINWVYLSAGSSNQYKILNI